MLSISVNCCFFINQIVKMVQKTSNALEQINCDLMAFYEYCKDNRLSDEEIKQICNPLFEIINKEKLKKKVRISGIIGLMLILLYTLSYSECLAWHLSALGRILLIKLLPVWDWTYLKTERCLISNNVGFNSKPRFECALCESINAIPTGEGFEPDYINERYIKLHTPLLVTNVALGNASLVEAILANPILEQSYPCKLSTNTNNGLGTLGRLLPKTAMFNSYFLHYQNCDFEAVKAFRVVVPRPPLLAAEISPIQYSWVLMSTNYNVTRYKEVRLVDRIAVFGQIFGGNYLRLSPDNICESECPQLEIEMAAGEALIFTSMWNLEYKPKPTGENLAVILETH